MGSKGRGRGRDGHTHPVDRRVLNMLWACIGLQQTTVGTVGVCVWSGGRLCVALCPRACLVPEQRRTFNVLNTCRRLLSEPSESHRADNTVVRST